MFLFPITLATHVFIPANFSKTPFFKRMALPTNSVLFHHSSRLCKKSTARAIGSFIRLFLWLWVWIFCSLYFFRTIQVAVEQLQSHRVYVLRLLVPVQNFSGVTAFFFSDYFSEPAFLFPTTPFRRKNSEDRRVFFLGLLAFFFLGLLFGIPAFFFRSHCCSRKSVRRKFPDKWQVENNSRKLVDYYYELLIPTIPD